MPGLVYGEAFLISTSNPVRGPLKISYKYLYSNRHAPFGAPSQNGVESIMAARERFVKELRDPATGTVGTRRRGRLTMTPALVRHNGPAHREKTTKVMGAPGLYWRECGRSGYDLARHRRECHDTAVPGLVCYQPVWRPMIRFLYSTLAHAGDRWHGELGVCRRAWCNDLSARVL